MAYNKSMIIKRPPPGLCKKIIKVSHLKGAVSTAYGIP